MRVAIAGAGNVGRSIAMELLSEGHQVLLIDKWEQTATKDDLRGAQFYLGDACELENLEAADLDSYDVSIAATGDDKANLVYSLLAKTEFGVPRTVARVNNPHNEWMFDDVWGVDVSVSTPRIMSALVEEAVTSGNLVKLLTFSGTQTDLSEIRIDDDSELVGRRVGDLRLPLEVVLVAVIRDGVPLTPLPDRAVEDNDQLLFLVPHGAREDLARVFSPQAETTS